MKRYGYDDIQKQVYSEHYDADHEKIFMHRRMR